MKKMIVVAILIGLCSPLFAAENIPDTLTVYAAKMKPCVILEEDEATGEIEITGFEVDLWKAVCKELAAQGIVTDCRFIPAEWSEIEPSVKSGKADVAMSGLTIRSHRMEWADFSMPTMNSGLGIIVLRENTGGILHTLNIMWNALKVPVILFCSFICLFAFVLWIIEKDDNPDNDAGGISDNFYPGFFEAIYFCIVTCSTVGYGDYTPKKWVSKIVVAVLIFSGIIAFCNFTALLSAEHVMEYTGEIKGPEDLKGKTVLTQKGTTSVDYVKKLGAKPKIVDDIDSACDWLLLKRGDAVVFDHPVLLNYAKDNPEQVRMVKGMFDEQYYGFMLKKDSPIRDSINLALLKLYEDGTYKTLYDKWF